MQLREAFPGNQSINEITAAVQSSVAEAVPCFPFGCGIPHGYSNNRWCWQAPGGLSIYLPLGVDDDKHDLYAQLQSSGGGWDEFLKAYWQVDPPVRDACAEQCQLPNGPSPITHRLYLPLIQR